MKSIQNLLLNSFLLFNHLLITLWRIHLLTWVVIFQRIFLEYVLKTNIKKIGREGSVDMSGTEKWRRSLRFNIENAKIKDWDRKAMQTIICFLGRWLLFVEQLGTFPCYHRKQHPARMALISVAKISICHFQKQKHKWGPMSFWLKT